MTWVAIGVIGVIGVANLLLSAVVFRQLGIFVMGTARGVNESGIPIGRQLLDVSLEALRGGSEQLKAMSWPGILYFVGPNCSECERTLPELKPLLEQVEGATVRFVSFGDKRRTKIWAIKHELDEDQVLLIDQKNGHQLDVAGTPFAYTINSDGKIAASGLLHTPEELLIALHAAGIQTSSSKTEWVSW